MPAALGCQSYGAVNAVCPGIMDTDQSHFFQWDCVHSEIFVRRDIKRAASLSELF